MAALCWVFVTAAIIIAVIIDRKRYQRLHGPRYVDRSRCARSIRRLSLAGLAVQVISAAVVVVLHQFGYFIDTAFLPAVTLLAVTFAAYLWVSIYWARETDRMERRIGLESLAT